MKTPTIIVNFKTYRTSFGKSALEIAKAAERVSREYGLDVIIAPPMLEIATLVRNVNIGVYAQHADPLYYGAHTGYTPIEALRDIGVRGVIINHSEHPVDLKTMARIIEISREMGLETVVCSDSVLLARIIATYYSPTAIALEPPELIGSGIAISRARPEIIVKGVNAIRSISKEIVILAGAGISSKEDAYRAIELGSEGILVASAIMLSSSPDKAISEMAESILRAWEDKRNRQAHDG